jgi:hypothetical protein
VLRKKKSHFRGENRLTLSHREQRRSAIPLAQWHRQTTNSPPTKILALARSSSIVRSRCSWSRVW